MFPREKFLDTVITLIEREVSWTNNENLREGQ